jgi:DNA-binding GntR family transcriptional regulator/DNA-binding LacI/PurR family transcriptional regulator
MREGVWRTGDMLPTLESLAAGAGVSRFTMARVIRILAAEKTVSTRRGGGIRLGPAEEANSLLRWKDVAQRINASVMNGELPSDALLPSISKLQMRYSTCYQTVHKALSTLVHQGVITQTGTRYLVPRMLMSGSTREVVLFTEKALETNESQQTLIQLSEKQAHGIGVRLLRYEHDLSIPFASLELQRLCARDSIAGFVMDFWGLSSERHTTNFHSLLAMLHAARKPLAIIDEIGILDLPEPLKTSRRIRIIASASRVAGEDVGRYLLQSGHRRIAFLAISPDQIWSQRRYSGLRRAFTAAGLPDTAVSLCRTTPQAGISQLVCTAAHLSRTEMEIMFMPGMSRTELDRLMAGRARIAEMLHLTRREINQVREQAEIAVELYRAGGAEGIAETVRARVFELIGQQYGQRYVEPMFTDLLSDDSITAWVASTDGIGFAAQIFLQGQSIDMPGRISLVAFDNTTLAATRNLTSYEFDLAGRLHHALSFAAGRAEFASKGPQTIEWPGVLYQRRSSGKAR